MDCFPHLERQHLHRASVSAMIYICNYSAAEPKTETRAVGVNNSDRCVSLCGILSARDQSGADQQISHSKGKSSTSTETPLQRLPPDGTHISYYCYKLYGSDISPPCILYI